LKKSLISCGAVALAIAALAGCAQSPVPMADNFNTTHQKKVRSAGHWQVIAQDAAREMLKMLDESGVAQNARVSLVSPDKPTDFDKTFHELLTTALVKSGRRVSADNQGTLKLSYKAQLVVHKSPRPQVTPGALTAVTAGVFALYGIRYEHVDTILATGLGAAALADYGASVNAGGPTSTELVLTTSASTPDQILARKTDVYYIESEDATLFKPAVQPPSLPTMPSMKVVNQ
jgi:hypothetical protein